MSKVRDSSSLSLFLSEPCCEWGLFVIRDVFKETLDISGISDISLSHVALSVLHSDVGETHISG